MTAKSADGTVSTETWATHDFTLTSGTIAYKGAAAALVIGTGYVRPVTGSAAEIVIGRFVAKVDASSAAKNCSVSLFDEINGQYFVNGASIVAADAGRLAYLDDDQTVVLTPSGATLLGTILKVDSVRGVLVAPVSINARASEQLVPGATLAFAAVDIVIPDYPRSGVVYAVPTSAANSTISLPAAAYPGTRLVFVADGTANGHTVTYRDVTTAISAAATASKRHQATAVFLGTTWTVTLTVGP